MISGSKNVRLLLFKVVQLQGIPNTEELRKGTEKSVSLRLNINGSKVAADHSVLGVTIPNSHKSEFHKQY